MSASEVRQGSWETDGTIAYHKSGGTPSRCAAGSSSPQGQEPGRRFSEDTRYDLHLPREGALHMEGERA